MLMVSRKGAKSAARYTLGGELLAEVAVSEHPHEIVRSPDGTRLFVTDNGVMQIENAVEVREDAAPDPALLLEP